MFILGPLVLIALIAVVIVVITRATQSARASAGPPDRAASNGGHGLPPALRAYLDRWTAAGLVTPQEASAIEAFEVAATEASLDALDHPRSTPRPTQPRRIPAVAEALGYLGGILAVLGVVLIVVRYWPDMAAPWRLAISGAAAVALMTAGALVSPGSDDALSRLRGSLWLGSTAAAAVVGGVVAADVLDAASAKSIVLAGALAVVLVSGALWWHRDAPLQQLTLLAGLVVVAGALVAHVTDGAAIGFAVWAVAFAMGYLGLRRWGPRAALTLGVATMSGAVGAIMVASAWEGPGLVFAVVTAFGLLALALVPRLVDARVDQLILGIVGAFLLVQVGPGSVGYYARDAGVLAGLSMWVVGGVLLFLGARKLVRIPLAVEIAGGAVILGGAAVTGVQWHGFAPIFGIVTAVALVAFGMLPGQLLLSVFGSIGLLINVLWAINWFFPGEGRAPVLITVAGALIVAIAVMLTRTGKHRPELKGPPRAAPGAV